MKSRSRKFLGTFKNFLINKLIPKTLINKVLIYPFLLNINQSELWKVYKQISEAFKAAKLQFFIFVPSPINNKGEVGFFTKQDTEQLAPYVNGFVLNTFDYSSEEV